MAEHRSLLARTASGLGVAAALAAGSGALLARTELVTPFFGFRVFGLGLLGGVLTFLLGVLALLATRRSERRVDRPLAWRASAIGLALTLLFLVLALPGGRVPAINDISTDPGDPPLFDSAARAPANRGRDLAYPTGFAPLQQAAYPDLQPFSVAAQPPEAFARALAAAQSLGWEITFSDPEGLRFEASQVSATFRFVDDVAVRVRPAGGGSRLDVRSKSRDGRSDLGANAARIRAFGEALRAASAG